MSTSRAVRLARRRSNSIWRWVAALTGPLLHIMFVAGAFSLFYEPLRIWEDPLAQLPSSVASYQRLLAAAAPPGGEFQLYLPRNDRGRPSIAYVPPGSDGWHSFWVGDSPSGSVPRREALAGFLYDLHFFWHRVTGLPLQYLGGFASLGYLVSGASHLVSAACHALLARRRRALRPLSAWLVLIARMPGMLYAYTGVLMVLGPLFVMAAIGPVFGGDGRRAIGVAGYFGEELAEEDPPEPGVEAPPLPLDDLVRRALLAEPELRIESFSAINYGYANGTIDVRGSVPGVARFASKRDTSVRLRSADGVVIDVQTPRSEGATAWVARWLQVIHHTSYAGTLLRGLLFALVAGGSCAFLASNWRWLAHRANGTSQGATPSRLLACWTAATGAGAFVSVAALFVTSRLLPLAWAGRVAAEELVFPVTLAACIGWGLLDGNTIGCCARQLRLAGVLLLPVPVLAARWSSAGLFGGGPRIPEVVLIDLGVTLLSIALLSAAVVVQRCVRSPSDAAPRWWAAGGSAGVRSNG